MKKCICVIMFLTFTSYVVANDEDDMNVRIAIAAAKAKADRIKKGENSADVKQAIENAHKDAKSKSITQNYKTKDGKEVSVTETTAKAPIPKKETREPCYADINVARKIAKRDNKTLIIWSGITCESHKATSEALKDCVNCHQDADENGKGIRIEKWDGTYIIPDSMIETTFPASTIKSLAVNTPKTGLRRVDPSQCPNGICPTGTYCDTGSCGVCPTGACASGNCVPNCPNGSCSSATKYVYRTVNGSPVCDCDYCTGKCVCPNGPDCGADCKNTKTSQISYPSQSYYSVPQYYSTPQQYYSVPRQQFFGGVFSSGGCAGGSCSSGR